jgi:putative peptidoglycan lipid II flippase
MLRLSGWTVGYVVANQCALLFVIVLASGREGGVSAYQYAFIFFQLPHGLFAVSLMTTIAPELARAANVHDYGALSRQFETGLRYLVLVVLPAAVAYLVLAHPVVGILANGAFAPGDAAVTADVLQALAVGLLPFSVYLYALRGFYSLQDTRTPFVVNLFQNGLNIVLALALFPELGVQGLGYAYAVSYVVAAVVALVALHRRIGGGVERSTGAVVLKAALAAAVLAVVAAPLAGAVGDAGTLRNLLAALLASATGGLVYLLVLRALGVTEMAAVTGLLRRRAPKSA